VQLSEAISEDRPCGLSPQSPPPMLLGQEICDLYFLTSVDRPRQQPAATDELIRLRERRRPEPEPVLAVLDVDDPLQLLFRLLIREGALGEVTSAARRRITI
jgi:hypothetical protein